MSDFARDSLDRSRLDWPEPLLIDLIADCYEHDPDLGDRVFAARLHVRFLHELVDGEARDAAFIRLDLITTCAARNIGFEAIERADEAAFFELRSVVDARFRNCARMRMHFLVRLEDARNRLPVRDEPRKQSATIRRLDDRRKVPSRAPDFRPQPLAVG